MRFTTYVLTLIILLVTAGCGTGNSNEATQTNRSTLTPKEAASPAASDTATLAPVKTVKHAMGTATLKNAPVRVVYLFQGMIDAGAALGIKPVGATETSDQKPWFKYLGDMSGVKNLGDEGQPNIEEIIALKPDLIIGTKARHEKIYSQLEAIAPTIITEDLADWKANLKLAGEALGKEGEATKMLDDWDKRVADFKTKMGSELSKTTVSLIRVQRDNSVKIYLKGFSGLIMRELGLSAPKAQQVEFSGSGLDILSKEHIPQFDADYIFDITAPIPGQENVSELHEEWKSHPLWKELNGVKNQKYFAVDHITWNLGAGPLAAKAMMDDVYRYFELK
ncbi:iron-siderophore ABC transporter substrate-binding protein [Paenibacillaceae bacterium]|nr:iron-siderophore ABC transporter substrate-binding protein [Paenibacillaceae bacterium]